MKNNSENLTFFQLTLMVLSILSVLIILVDMFSELDPEVSTVIQLADFSICILFLYDFIYRLIKADNKLKFMKWGWIDLISSVPMLDIFRGGRLVRVIRLIRLLRLFRASKMLTEFILTNRKKNAVLSAVLITVLLIFVSSVGILMVEPGSSECNISTAEDAIWWSFVTLTTVGYGDRYPVTTEGRFIAALLMSAGVGLFGTFTGLVASWFLGENRG